MSMDMIKDAYRHFADLFRSVGEPPTAGALRELCSSAPCYAEGRCDVQPYAEAKVAWPPECTHLVDLLRLVQDADRKWLKGWQTMLVDVETATAAQREHGLHRPYSDPVLKHNQTKYKEFIGHLLKRNMIKFKMSSDEAGSLGVFFVKKNNMIRLIFDTRILNTYFKPPPKTDLPSAASFTSLQSLSSSSLYMATGDLASAFYTLEVPDDMARMFTLDAVRAGDFGITTVDGVAVEPSQLLTPYITVLPMGFSWSLHLCQSVLNNAIQKSGFNSSSIISDKGYPVTLRKVDDTAAAGYVDNFAVIGHNAKEVQARSNVIAKTLRSWGLTVHEEVEASLDCDFVGLHMDGKRQTFSIKPSRLLRLRAAIDELLIRNSCSGDIMQILLGHLTWAMLCRRESLSFVDKCYAFCSKNLDNHKSRKLWPSVRRELRQIRNILPLIYANTSAEWHSQVTASDSSPFGYGVCQRELDSHSLRSIGSCSEKWRFRFEDCIAARSHTFHYTRLTPHITTTHFSPPPGLESQQPTSIENSINTTLTEFNEIPQTLLQPDDWQTVWSAPWKHKANILHTEALALVWSFKHQVRNKSAFNKRLVALVDNLPLCLSAVKGRGRSGHLKGPLRHIACISLVTGCRLHVRWIPSEWNIADKPSRSLNAWTRRGLANWWNHSSAIGSSNHSYIHQLDASLDP